MYDSVGSKPSWRASAEDIGLAASQQGRFKLSEFQFRELCRFLHGFLIYHLGKFPPGRLHALEEPSAATSRASKSSAK